MSNSFDLDQGDILLGLIYVQTFCKVYQLVEKIDTSRENMYIRSQEMK